MSDIRTEDEAAIRRVLDDSYRAWAAGDAAGMVAGYTADATAIMPGSLREGRDAIRESMAQAFAGPLKGTSIHSRQVSLRFTGVGSAIVVSESGILFPGQTEVPDEGKVNATWVLEQSDPVARVIERSSVRLAFVAALQHLSAGQRGALILRDVLGFPASEAAEILGVTVAAVNSSLQGARTALAQARVAQEQLREPSAGEQRAWVDRYMEAFERADVEGLTRLLVDDVLMEMPPLLNWFSGPQNYGVFMEWVFTANGTDWRLLPVAANGQAGFAAYNRVDDAYQLHTVQILTVTEGGISRTSIFQDAGVFASFKLPQTLGVASSAL